MKIPFLDIFSYHYVMTHFILQLIHH